MVQVQGQTSRQTNSQTDRQTDNWADLQTDIQRDSQTGKDRDPERQAERQLLGLGETDRRTDRQLHVATVVTTRTDAMKETNFLVF